MAARKQVEGSDPIGTDGTGGASQAPDVKKYHIFQVISNKHIFSAPLNKYKDLLGVLGLRDIDSDEANLEGGIKLQQGTAYINLTVRTNNGTSLRVVCDPEKVGTALKEVPKHKIYDEAIRSVRIAKRRVYL